VQYREVRRGEVVFVCVMPDRTGEVIPAWMFDPAACARMALGLPRVAVEALEQVRAILREVGFDGGAVARDERPQERSDANAAAPAIVDSSADPSTAPSARHARADQARRKEPGERRCRARKVAAGGSALVPRKRGDQ